MRTTIVTQGADGAPALWQPTTLDQLGKLEVDLEVALANTPELLGLESRRTGIYGPFMVFRQLELATPEGRAVYPDIVLLAASGDIVVVEVKRFVNPELKDRSVVAQIIDYVSSLAALTEEGMARLFNGGKQVEWASLVAGFFPGQEDIEELAATLLANARQGDLHMVIACDKAPNGLYERARSVSAQSHLGFSLDVVEVCPFVRKDGSADTIMFVPELRLSTEIVARTVVTVTDQQGAPLPSVSVTTTSVEAIEENLAAAAQGKTLQSHQRNWSNQEIEDVFSANDDPVVHDLFLFAKNEGYHGRIQSQAPKASATFGFYMHVRRQDGSEGVQQFFNCVDGAKKLVIYTKWSPETVPPPVLEAYKSELRAILGPDIDNPEPNIPLAVIGEHLEEFKAAVRKLQVQIDPDREAVGQPG